MKLQSNSIIGLSGLRVKENGHRILPSKPKHRRIKCIVACQLNCHGLDNGRNHSQNNDPAEILGVSDRWILQLEVYGTLKLYWGGADKVMCAGTAVIDELVELCLTDSRPPL
jgi:hypothetical protein